MELNDFDVLYNKVVDDIKAGRLTGLTDDADDTDDDAIYIYSSSHNKNVSALVDFFDNHFITPSGQCDYGNIREVMSAHNEIKIYAGDKDSFGWLTGCFDFEVDGQRYIIVYG